MAATRALGLLVLVFATFLSGCSGDSDEGETPTDGADGTAPEADSFAAPANWSLGQWWRYDVESNFPDGEGGPTTIIVTNDTATDFITDTTSRDQAAFDAEMDVSYIGPIRKSDLAGQQGDARVEYFRFPLDNGTGWTTTWDGVAREVRALGVVDGVFLLEAYEGDALRVRYSYDPEPGFFGFLEFYQGNGTEPGFSLTLSDWGMNYTGPYIRAEIGVGVHASGSGAASFSDGVWTVAEGTQELLIRWGFDCDTGTGRVTVSVNPSGPAAAIGEGYTFSEICNGPIGENLTIEAPAPGEWRYDGLYQGGGAYDIVIFTRNFFDLMYP